MRKLTLHQRDLYRHSNAVRGCVIPYFLPRFTGYKTHPAGAGLNKPMSYLPLNR